jgi:DNA-binding NtrC family response regulator
MDDRCTVLIVDDEPGPRQSLRMLLKPLYRLEEAEGGHRAMEIVRRGGIDLVTLDLKMPGMDGAAVLKAIKEVDPNIPVLIITGHGTLRDAIELVRLGACGYLMKPFDVAEVTREIAQAIERKGKLDRLDRQFK